MGWQEYSYNLFQKYYKLDISYHTGEYNSDIFTNGLKVSYIKKVF